MSNDRGESDVGRRSLTTEPIKIKIKQNGKQIISDK